MGKIEIVTDRQAVGDGRPRLLFISPRFLFPLDEGGKIRTAGTLRAMRGGAFHITLVGPAPADWQRHSAEIASVCDVFRPWPMPGAKGLRRIAGLIGSTPVSAATDRTGTACAIVQEELAAKPDLALFDFAHAGVFMPPRIEVPTVLFTHNIEAEILERHAGVATGPAKWIWQREAAKMRAFEGQALRRCDRVIAVSARDAKGLAEQYRLPVVDLVDTGVDLDFYGYHAPDEQTNTVVFSGAMDSRSNIDGISFLMEEVWPHLMALRPDARMIVAGRNPPQALVEKARARRLNWEFTGYVDDIRAPVLAGSVSVIPLRVGSGTRLKAFEAVALGRPIVSTTIGVEGLPLEPGRHCLIADDGPAFAQALARLLEDREERVRIARAARDLLEERFSWAHIGKQFEGICLRAIGR